MSAASPQALPRSLAHFRLLAPLGEGGFGRVYQAWDTRLERLVALKVAHGGGGSREAAALHEARLTIRIDHPAFARIYEYIATDEGDAIAMELVPGRTLASLLDEGPVPTAMALGFVRQAAMALSAAHARDIVHGDLKPSNLMVTAEGTVRILDLGLARVDEATRSDLDAVGIAGTLAYLAPEVLLGRSPDPRADVYALGRVLHELLAGTTVYGDMQGAALAHAVLYEPLPALLPAGGEGSKALDALLQAMLERDPQRRIADLAEVCRRIDTLVVSAMPRRRAADRAPPALPTAPPNWREPTLLLALLVAITLAAVAGRFGASWRGGGSDDAESVRPAAVTASPTVEIESLLAAERDLRRFDEPDALSRAIGRYESILVARPDHAAAAAGLAIAWCLRYTSGDPDATWLARAHAAATVALRADDQLALAHTADGWVRDLEGDTTGADEAFRRALALDPGGFLALQGYARLLTREGRYDRADEIVAAALARWPNERIFLDAQGLLRFRQADYTGAEAAFRRSIAAKPDSPFAYANLNAALLRQDRIDEALEVLQQGLRARPHARLYGNLGTALFARGRYAEAADAFERALRGTHGEPSDYLKWANLGDALRQMPGREADARRAFARALQLLEPQLETATPDATLLSRAALYEAKQGDAKRAAELVARAAPLGADADLLFRLAIAAELAGDRALALTFLERAVAAGYPRRLIASEPELLALRRDGRYPDIVHEETATP